MSTVSVRKGAFLDAIRPDWQRLDAALKYDPPPFDVTRCT
jgi:hypothetical protein